MHPIIAISGPPGSGKSSIARALIKALSNSSDNNKACAAVHIDIDDYQQFTSSSIGDIEQWLNNGADYNDFSIEHLPEDLNKLKHGNEIICKKTGETINISGPIIFETHFGREHHSTGKHIDYLIWLELPLDIAFARNVDKFCKDFLNHPDDHSSQINWLSEYTQNYISTTGKALAQQDRIRKNSDLQIDALLNPEILSKQIISKLNMLSD